LRNEFNEIARVGGTDYQIARVGGIDSKRLQRLNGWNLFKFKGSKDDLYQIGRVGGIGSIKSKGVE
jgi:hypothetical protein